jgi:uncharacterized protein
MTEDAATFRIKDFISFVDSSQETLRAEQLKREVVERYLPEGFTYELTSRPIIWAHVIHRIVDSQVINFIFAFVFICLLIGLIFRSLRIGLISMLGWLKIPLNAFTAMTACVAIGLVVDDTIHFISYFRNEIEKGIPTRASLLATFENVGFPITITSSILAIGCSLFYFSGLTTTAEFGLLVSAICILALLADLFLLAPILLLTHEPSLSQKS